MKLEAPPGFEPGVEVLQSGLAITKLLSRLAFWSALILVLPRFRRVPFPSCSQVHFPRKLLIFDLRFDRLHQVRHERVRPRLAAAAPGRTRTASFEHLTESFSTKRPSLSTMPSVIGQIGVMRCFTARTWVPRKAGRGCLAAH